jgi:peptide/nickel transport system substrate-binding protein
MTSYMAEPFTQALEEAINHDLNPRAMSPKVKGFRPAQSWFQDFTSVYMD